MNEERRSILDMLAEGKITAVEAERLLAALERGQPSPPPSADARPKAKAKYLRVVIDSHDEGEQARVNVRVPLQLLRAGVKLAALLPPQALSRANVELARSGWPMDLSQLKPEQLEELIEHLDEMTVEVDDPTATVRVFCE